MTTMKKDRKESGNVPNLLQTIKKKRRPTKE